MYRLPFGKYRGRSIIAIAMDDPGYCDWLLSQPWFVEKYPTLQTTLIASRSGDHIASEDAIHTIAEPPPRRRSARRKGRQQPLAEAIQASVAFVAPPEVVDGGCVVLRPRAFAQRAQ